MSTGERVPFIGSDPAIEDLLRTVRLVADTDATVLITGETGTGKELIATALHDNSSRRNRPFIAVNCGALADTLLESELFGHLRGSFTDATEARPGKFGAADGGTLFLDEVADMNHPLQLKLLRVLQTGEYSPVGSALSRTCDVRVVAATNVPLQPLLASGRLRADLYYRLNVVCLDIPPLRARPGDILVLASHFLRLFAAKYRRRERSLSSGANHALLSYGFPGNVRELENAIRRAVILGEGDEIRLEDLPPEMRTAPEACSTREPSAFHEARARALEQFEREFLVTLLQASAGVVKHAAQRSGVSERHLHAKLREYGLRGRDFRPADARTVDPALTSTSVSTAGSHHPPRWRSGLLEGVNPPVSRTSRR
jgi:DNA-binding NtrC family response regulator